MIHLHVLSQTLWTRGSICRTLFQTRRYPCSIQWQQALLRALRRLRRMFKRPPGSKKNHARKINNLTARLSSLEEKVTQLLQPALTRRRAVRNLLRVFSCVVCREHPHLDKARLADSCCSTMVCSTCLDVWSASAARDIANDIDIAAGLPCPACRVSVPKASFICLPQWPALAGSLKELALNDDFC